MSSSNDPLLQVSDDASNRYPVADPALRKSCDRCYSQKLKCSKTDISPDCCVRCARAGVACFYSTRLARQSQKRLSSADSRGAQRLPKRSRQEPLTSPGFVDDALFDPMQRVHFDLDTTDITDASLLSTNHAEYAWPPEDWVNTESVMTIPVLPEAPLSFIPQPEALSSDTSSAESHADKLPELSASILPDDHNEHSLNHSLTKVIRPTSHRSSSSSEVKLVRFGAYDKQVSLFHNRPLSAHEPYTGRATANTRAHASSYSEDLQALSHRLEEYHQRLSVADVRVDLYTYPVGETLDGSKELLDILHQDGRTSTSPHLRSRSFDHPTFSRTTQSFLALQCYVLCVKILTRACQNFLAHPLILAESEHHDTLRNSPKTAKMPQPKREERPSDLIETAMCLPVHSEMLLGELILQLDPLGHALTCISGTLSTGIKLLRGIEAKLGIPKASGVCSEQNTARRPADAPPTTLTAAVTNEPCNGEQQQQQQPTVAATPPLKSSGKVAALHSVHTQEEDGRAQSAASAANASIDQSIQERLITVLWDDSCILNVASGAKERAPLVLQRCGKQINTLMRSHMLAVYDT